MLRRNYFVVDDFPYECTLLLLSGTAVRGNHRFVRDCCEVLAGSHKDEFLTCSRLDRLSSRLSSCVALSRSKKNLTKETQQRVVFDSVLPAPNQSLSDKTFCCDIFTKIFSV